jgi:hypothetical protein
MPDGELIGSSHLLCVFSEGEHAIYSLSDDWADIELFTQKALEVARQRLDFSDEVIELRDEPQA